MNTLYIGGGFVGTCSAAVAADSGHQVLVFDVNKQRVDLLSSGDRNAIELALFEEGLSDLLIRNKERIAFTADYELVKQFLETCEIIFMCVPTPSGEEGATDLSYFTLATTELGKHLALRQAGSQTNRVVIVNKSTVPVNALGITKEIMDNQGAKNYGLASNPEFLVEGKAVEGSMRPDRIVIGAADEADRKALRRFYQRFYDSPTVKYLEVSPSEAAAGKLLANYLLFNRLMTTFQVVGRVCEAFPEIKFENIRQILTTDDRIGTWGFYDSFYAGGSCLLKDSASLAHQLEVAGSSADQVREAINGNNAQLTNFYNRAQEEARYSWKGKTIAVLGVAFKRDTNDVRNSGAVKIVEKLLKDGVKQIRVYDPAALPMFKEATKQNADKFVYCSTEEEALAESQACLLLTDWPQFRTSAESITQLCQAPYLIMDGRRMLRDSYADLQNKGFTIIAVGSPFILGKQ